jgi:hypothetical protein
VDEISDEELKKLLYEWPMIYIFIMVKDVEHCFVCLFVNSFSENCLLFNSFAHLLIGLFVLYDVWFFEFFPYSGY